MGDDKPYEYLSGVESTCPTTAIDYFNELTRKIWRVIFHIMLHGGYFEYWKARLVVVDSNLNSRGSIEDFVSFREMITSQLLYLRVGSLMYLTSSRLNLVVAVYMYAWYQAKPMEKHLHECIVLVRQSSRLVFKEIEKNYYLIYREINMQQFWHTVSYNLEDQTYFFTLDDQVFEVNAYLLCDALKITPKVSDHPSVQPPSENEIISFIKRLGYHGSLNQVSNMVINNMYQPWRTFMTMINKCLTRKASKFDRPRLALLQVL
nr:hypothetical protein [Tanacetum cinerariifolium]